MNTENIGSRPFEDLIKEIEFEGDTFTPIHKISALCFNYNEEAAKNDGRMWINNSYDHMAWYSFKTKVSYVLGNPTHECLVGITRNFDIRTYHNFGTTSNPAMPHSNQVKIIKLLTDWGFIG